MSAAITFTGLDAILRALVQLDNQIEAAIAGGVYSFAQRVMADAVKRTPVDNGFLKGSAFVLAPEIARDSITVGVGFAMEYAAAVHERNDENLNMVADPRVGEDHFLRKAMDAWRGKASRTISTDARKLFLAGQGFRSVSRGVPITPKHSGPGNG